MGFDAPPARYIAEPGMVLMSYFGIRYVMLDNWRAKLEKDAGELKKFWYLASRAANLLFAVTMLFWPMLLIIAPQGSGDEDNFEAWHLNYHFCACC